MSVYKTANEAYESLKANLENKLGDNIQTGSVIDIYNKVIADECEEMYALIENNKNPYLFTNTYGEDLDSLGYWVNLTRKDNETDDEYKFRLKDWMLTSEASNTTAISNSLLSPTYASNIQYVPYTHGAGTATCYIIPKEYEEETISLAMEEAYNLMKDVVSPSLYIEYIIPSILSVKLQCYIVTKGDEASIKSNITKKIQGYVNSIAPDDYLKIGDIIKIGLNESEVEYFNVVSYFIDNEEQTSISKIQGLETKFLFDSIKWVDNSVLEL